MELTKDTATEILVKCVHLGQSKGAYSIKDAAFLHKVTVEVKEEKGRILPNYEALIKATIVANGKGAYNLEDAALIEQVVSFLEKEKLVTVVAPTPTSSKETA